MTLPSIDSSFNLTRTIVEARQQANDLQRQLATGKKSTTYGGLEAKRAQVLSFRSELSEIEGYRQTTSLVNIRLETSAVALKRIRTIASQVKTDSLATDFDLAQSGQTRYQAEARALFVDTVSVLNTDVAGRHLFGGRVTEDNPLAAPESILDGAGGKTGFAQIAAERRQADLGADGRGRLIISAPSAATVALAEDVAGSPFGFKLNAVSSNLTGTTVTGPAGAPPSLDVAFTATLPQDGESIRISLNLPDGTTADLELTASATPTSDPDKFQIGVDETATAANFQATLTGLIETTALRDLSAASAFAAASNFFDYDETTPPQRVDGPPFNTATALVDADPADTIFYYQGELSSNPARQSAVTKVDGSINVAYGLRADEEAFRTLLKSLAVLSVETFSSSEDEDEKALYSEIRKRVNSDLSFSSGRQSVDNIIAELTTVQQIIGDSEKRYDASEALLGGFIADAEDTDIYEVSAQILSLQTRIQASLQVTALLQQTTLVNFL